MKKKSFVFAAIAAMLLVTNVLSAQTESSPNSGVPDAVSFSQKYTVTVRFRVTPSEQSEAAPARDQAGMAFGSQIVFTALPPENFLDSQITVLQNGNPNEVPIREHPLVIRLASGQMLIAVLPSSKLEVPNMHFASEFNELFLVTPGHVKKISELHDAEEATQFIGALVVNERGELWGVATVQWWDESLPAHLIARFPEILDFFAQLKQQRNSEDPHSHPLDLNKVRIDRI